jgi:hypothetical protein
MTAYLAKIENSDRNALLDFVGDNRSARVWPIRTKLITLKMVPRIKPLADGLSPIPINTRPIRMATVIARDPYFFWVCLTVSIFLFFAGRFVVFGHIHYLAINRNPAADDAQYRENGDKDAFRIQPPVQVQSDQKTKNNTAGHGQTGLHDDMKALRPGTVFFIIENHFCSRAKSAFRTFPLITLKVKRQLL